MANASMWCLPTNVHKEWFAGYCCKNDRESNIFQWQEPFILEHDIDENISLTYQYSLKYSSLTHHGLLINKQTVLLYELFIIKSKVLSIEAYS